MSGSTGDDSATSAAEWQMTGIEAVATEVKAVE